MARMKAAAADPIEAYDQAEAMIEAAERKRRAVAVERKPYRGGTQPDDEAGDIHDGIDTVEDDVGPARTPDQRKPRRRAKPVEPEADTNTAIPVRKNKPGLITRGVHVGMGSAHRFGLWGIAAGALAIALVVLSFTSLTQVPPPSPVSGFRVDYLPGPQLAQQDVYAWLTTFPQRDRLGNPDAEVLNQLADHLRAQAVVAEVNRVEVVHEGEALDPEHVQRILHLTLRLRQPAMPVVLASGVRAWVDREGWLLPGTLPGPAIKRPVLRAVEWGGVEGVRAALELWARLEPKIEPNLITDIHLNDVIDEKGKVRGIVLYTRRGARLIWGRPGEEQYGVSFDDRARNLLHTLRCQGDVGRVASVNVRFRQPVFTLKEAQ